MWDQSINPFENKHSTAEWDELEEDLDDSIRGFGPEAFVLAEQIHDFLRRTPELTPTEQAELVGAAVLNARQGASYGESNASEVDWSQVARGIQTGLSAFQAGAQIAGGLAGAFGGNNQTARDFATWANRLGQGAGQVGGMLQAFQGGQVRSPPATAPGRAAQPRGRGRRHRAPARQPAASPITAPTMPTQPTIPTVAPAGAPLDATALMGVLLNNPQLLQAIRSAPFMGQIGTPRVEVNLPNAAPVSMPLESVMSTIAQLANESVRELKAVSSEDGTDIPEYLIGEDGELIVDPASREDRNTIVLEWLRKAGEAQRYAETNGTLTTYGMDESDAWAREAGFDG